MRKFENYGQFLLTVETAVRALNAIDSTRSRDEAVAQEIAIELGLVPRSQKGRGSCTIVHSIIGLGPLYLKRSLSGKDVFDIHYFLSRIWETFNEYLVAEQARAA